MRFVVRRECVLDDTLRTAQWPNFCVYDRVVVSLSVGYILYIYIYVGAYRGGGQGGAFALPRCM